MNFAEAMRVKGCENLQTFHSVLPSSLCCSINVFEFFRLGQSSLSQTSLLEVACRILHSIKNKRVGIVVRGMEADL